VARISPARIGYVIGQLTRGGAEQQLYELVRGIDRQRFHCVVYCLSERTDPFGEMIAATGVAVKTLPHRRRLELGRILTLARLARADRIDVLHAFLVHASGYAWPAQRLAGVPCLITSARSGRTAGGVRDWIIGRAFQSSDAVICNGEAVREFIAHRYSAPTAKCRVIYNGVDLTRFSPRSASAPALDHQGPTIITVGRLVAEKDLLLFLEAAALMLRACPSARFLIVGEGPCRSELERGAAERGLGPAVSFLGGRADIPDLLHAADVFWLTSASEGLPNALLEAQASAVPVVTRDVGAAREIVRHGVTGYVVPRRDAPAFVAYTRELLANPERARAMGLAGRRVVEATFSLDVMVRSTERLYETLLASGRRE
jgi:glycosyltransferase involved in cell wall biosynthesis